MKVIPQNVTVPLVRVTVTNVDPPLSFKLYATSTLCVGLPPAIVHGEPLSPPTQVPPPLSEVQGFVVHIHTEAIVGAPPVNPFVPMPSIIVLFGVVAAGHATVHVKLPVLQPSLTIFCRGIQGDTVNATAENTACPVGDCVTVGAAPLDVFNESINCPFPGVPDA